MPRAFSKDAKGREDPIQRASMMQHPAVPARPAPQDRRRRAVPASSGEGQGASSLLQPRPLMLSFLLRELHVVGP